MALASHLPGSWNTAAWFARICGCSRALAPLPIFVLLFAPAPVRGDIYKWTDERGNTIISNVQPVGPGKVSGMELLAAETRPAAPSPVAGSQAAPARTEEALQARIENLERQLQAQQLAQQSQGVPQSNYSEDYYPAPPPPPPYPNYYSNYGPVYSSGYYPYPPPVSYYYAAIPARPAVRRPAFVSRPVFVGRPPVFVGRPPVFVSQPALGFSRPASFTGGSMHRGRR